MAKKLEVVLKGYDRPMEFIDGTIENWCVWIRKEDGTTAYTGQRFEHERDARIAYNAMKAALLAASLA
jgi:hypothetical protein